MDPARWLAWLCDVGIGMKKEIAELFGVCFHARDVQRRLTA